MKTFFCRAVVCGILLACGVCSGRGQTATIKPQDLGLSDETQTFPLWTGAVPEAVGADAADKPTLTYYAALSGVPTAVIVAPGGGYQMLALNHEGRQVANWLNSIGVTAFVLHYRLGPRYKPSTALVDAQRAVRFVRAHAEEFHVRPDRIGMIGFSAGGHLTASLETNFDAGDPRAPDAVDQASSRPDFAILAYAPAPFTPRAEQHTSTKAQTAATDYGKISAEIAERLHVTSNTPPTFLVATADDNHVGAGSSIALYVALQEKHVPAELHIFQTGGHGFGLGLGDPALSAWPGLLPNWLRSLGMMAK